MAMSAATIERLMPATRWRRRARSSGQSRREATSTLDVPHRRKDLPRLWLADVVDPQTQMAGAPDLGRGWGLFLGRHERDKVSRPETLDVFRHSLQTADVDVTHAKIIACWCTVLSTIPSQARATKPTRGGGSSKNSREVSGPSSRLNRSRSKTGRRTRRCQSTIGHMGHRQEQRQSIGTVFSYPHSGHLNRRRRPAG